MGWFDEQRVEVERTAARGIVIEQRKKGLATNSYWKMARVTRE